ncbi:hypothetical protein JRQ81_003383 [Phrynocephalus forsythii]|uniref:Uncharacterized protein n=1 Tax=Phrynocephalus forsythii TaxID=171643 RepID=A0A9Q1AX57_9SAUR|nr:hypothetical protein JRQ81_003383 [Phrynocephalus forsythii]
MIAIPEVEMRAQELMAPTRAQVPVPGRKVTAQNKERVTTFTEGPTVVTRSMQKKKDQILLKSTESLPNISRLLVRALASREADRGLTFAELKDMLNTKGYDVTRHCPSLKRKLNVLLSKGALVRMTHQSGSMFFVVRKYPEKNPEIFGNSEEGIGAEKAPGVDRRKAMQGAPPKIKGGAQPAKRAGQKSQESRQSLQKARKNLQPRGKQSRPPARPSSSSKRSQSIFSTRQRASPSGSKARPLAKNRRAVSRSEQPRNRRKRETVSSSKTARSAVCKITSAQSRSSSRTVLALAKEQGSPYSRQPHSTKKMRCCQSRRSMPLPQEQRSLGRKASRPSQTAKSNMVSDTKRAQRRP